MAKITIPHHALNGGFGLHLTALAYPAIEVR